VAESSIKYNMSMENRYTDGSYLTHNPSWHTEDAPWKLSHILPLLEEAGIYSPRRVLDAGCGSGGIIKLWAARAPQTEFVGWDISPQAHALAVQDNPHQVHFVTGCQAPQGPFEVALAIDVLEHVPEAEEWLRKLLSLAPFVVLHVPLDLSVRSLLKPEILEEERQKVGHIHFFTAASLKRLLKKHHCRILAARYTNKYVERPPQLFGWKSRLGMCIRRVAHKGIPHAWAAWGVGGYSLMLVVQTPSSQNHHQ